MNYKLEFEEKDLNVIVNCLVEAPYKISAPVLAAIQQQITSQQVAQQQTQNAECNKGVDTPDEVKE